MRVVSLNQSHRDAFLRMLDDYVANDPEPGEWYARGRDDFDAYIQSLEDEEQGRNLEPDHVPCSNRWLLDDDENIVGIVRIRHTIDTPFLFAEVGHIGYDVPPAHRKMGYGIASLQAGLQVAKDLGIAKVLIHADNANPPSWRTIERCGGVLEGDYWSDFWNCQVRRYWLEIEPANR
jgi:predicted acetyltransferase